MRGRAVLIRDLRTIDAGHRVEIADAIVAVEWMTAMAGESAGERCPAVEGWAEARGTLVTRDSWSLAYSHAALARGRPRRRTGILDSPTRGLRAPGGGQQTTAVPALLLTSDDLAGPRATVDPPTNNLEHPTSGHALFRDIIISPTMSRPKTAVVVGATNGIGRGIACRLAREGFRVVAVGRDREGREAEVLRFLGECSASASSSSAPSSSAECSSSSNGIGHEFRPCDAFELALVKSCARDIARDHESLDALVMTQGMATVQKFTPTSEGNDQKLTLHFWSRAAFAACLLPALRTTQPSAFMPGGPVVLSVLSGGVHSPYSQYRDDPELKEHYSISNAANFAGYYNDLFFDKLAVQPSNRGINFVHAAPGFVASNWGTEMPAWLRKPIRGMQRLMGKSIDECAEFMVRPMLQCADGGLELEPPPRPAGSTAEPRRGLYVMKEDGTGGKLTKGHTEEAMDAVWSSTEDVLGRAGIVLEGEG
ncbi:hypothetical protein ACHAWF_004906 [Thalassiosira exigua]